MFQVFHESGFSPEMTYTSAVLLAEEMSEQLDGVVRVIGPDGIVAAFCGGARTLPVKAHLDESLSEIKKSHVESVLGAEDWHVKKAAAVLGIGTTTLYRLMESYGIAKVKSASAG
jgi:DNA-binding NtrC family response regulator